MCPLSPIKAHLNATRSSIIQTEMQEPLPNSDPALLHPLFREKAFNLLDHLHAESIPIQLFEGFRSADRQRYLFAQGRARWNSYHQSGLAADFALSDEKPGSWRRFQEIAEQLGLATSTSEIGHVQLAGLRCEDLAVAA